MPLHLQSLQGHVRTAGAHRVQRTAPGPWDAWSKKENFIELSSDQLLRGQAVSILSGYMCATDAGQPLLAGCLGT